MPLHPCPTCRGTGKFYPLLTESPLCLVCNGERYVEDQPVAAAPVCKELGMKTEAEIRAAEAMREAAAKVAYEIANECDMAASQTFESTRSHPFGGGFTDNVLANGGRHAALLIESRIRALPLPSTSAPVAREEEILREMARAAFEFRPDGKEPLIKWADASRDAKDWHISNMRAAFAVAKRHWGK